MSVDANFSLGRVNTALTPQERFEEFMQTRGKRITRQRQVIVDHVTTRHEHFDAEQLLVDLKKTPELYYQRMSMPATGPDMVASHL